MSFDTAVTITYSKREEDNAYTSALSEEEKTNPQLLVTCSVAIHLVHVVVDLLLFKNIAGSRMLPSLSLDFSCTAVSFGMRGSEFSIHCHRDESRVSL